MRKLVNLVRKGGGSRYMSYSEKLTHIVVGSPSDVEKKELRGLAALGVIQIVKALWLEDCDRQKKEIPVTQRHAAYDTLLPKGLSTKGAAFGTNGVKKEAAFAMPQCLSTDTSRPGTTRNAVVIDETRGSKCEGNMNIKCSLEGKVGPSQLIPQSASNSQHRNQQKIVQNHAKLATPEKASGVFMGRLFCFSDSFPVNRKEEIIEWIHQGGGSVVGNQRRERVDFIVECHGVIPGTSNSSENVYVSSHWIRSCLEDGVLVDTADHILYSPLPCQVPLPGFEVFRFSVSQYEDKERLLLRNLSFVLGAKFGEKLTKKVTHLLCKFSSGPKYEAACRWGIPTVTCEWLYNCVRKDEVAPLHPYHPKKVSALDRDAGFCTSQYPTQAVRMISADDSSQIRSGSLDSTQPQTINTGVTHGSGGNNIKPLGGSNKRARLFGNESPKVANRDSYKNISSSETLGKRKEDTAKENTNAVPDVATAIEDLLEQTSKIHESKSPGEAECSRAIFSSDCPVLGANHSDSHSSFGMSKNWLSRIEKKDEPQEPSKDQRQGFYDGFSETQTDSQLVGYEEDLSGRQMIIDRVRTRSTAP